jgi:hypothetical protein
MPTLTRATMGRLTPSGILRRGAVTRGGEGTAGGGPVVIFPDGDLNPVPVELPAPAAILTGNWQFVATPDQASATLPNSFGMICLFGIDGNHRLALQDAGDAYRLDLYQDGGGGAQQVGSMEWTGTPAIHFEIDRDTSTIRADVLSGAVTFFGAWDTVVGMSATKVLTPWAWTGTTLNVGGFAGNFEFDGTITSVLEL